MPRRTRTRTLHAWRDPEVVFRALHASAPYAVWLDGGADAASGISVLAAAHPGSVFVTADAAAGTVTQATPVDADAEPMTHGASVFDVLADGLRDAATDEADSGPLGWFGWFGYELGAHLNEVPADRAETPDAAFLFVDRAIVFDHAARQVRLVWLESEDDSDAAWADEVEAAIVALDEAPAPPSRPHPHPPTRAERPAVRWRHEPDRYAELIASCQAAIVRGDAYQLCLTNRVDVDIRPDPATAYLALRASSPSHHGGYLRFGNLALLSASPELFLHVGADRIVSTKPMKGTRPRGADATTDEALRTELIASEKERAENLMIVDLMRNDLGRIAELGSVSVPSLLEVEEYAHVHQLVSTVQARLRHPLTALDAAQAAFPAGSMTGAPKRSAMTILHELEGGPRGVYSGTFGYLGVDGTADLAMVIRSIVLTPSGASIGTGGGITALSVADEEIEETRVKARALLTVLRGASDRAE
ncbi:aminodeoxychorismate synthase component I [Agromyces bauzanensis]